MMAQGYVNFHPRPFNNQSPASGFSGIWKRVLETMGINSERSFKSQLPTGGAAEFTPNTRFLPNDSPIAGAFAVFNNPPVYQNGGMEYQPDFSVQAYGLQSDYTGEYDVEGLYQTESD